MINQVKMKIKLWKKDIEYLEERRTELKNKSKMSGDEAIEYIKLSQNINDLKDMIEALKFKDKYNV